MLVIRPAQVAAIERGSLEERLIADLRAELPERCETLGSGATVRLVREAYTRAAACGLTTPPSIALFVRVSLIFGAGFEERHPWAAAALEDRSDPDEAARRKRLQTAALWHLQKLETAEAV